LPGQKGAIARDPSRAPKAAFLSSPLTRIRVRKNVSESLGRSIQDLIFHKSEINSLDSGIPRNPVGLAENRHFRCYQNLYRGANRGNCWVFVWAKKIGPPDHPDGPI
jgi:hypothetical protein